MSLQGDEWVLEGVAASPAWGMSTHVTSWLCKNWATFGQGGEVLAKAVSLLTDSYLLRVWGGNNYQEICHWRALSASSAVSGLLSAKHPDRRITGLKTQKIKEDRHPFPSWSRSGEVEDG